MKTEDVAFIGTDDDRAYAVRKLTTRTGKVLANMMLLEKCGLYRRDGQPVLGFKVGISIEAEYIPELIDALKTFVGEETQT